MCEPLWPSTQRPWNQSLGPGFVEMGWAPNGDFWGTHDAKVHATPKDNCLFQWCLISMNSSAWPFGALPGHLLIRDTWKTWRSQRPCRRDLSWHRFIRGLTQKTFPLLQQECMGEASSLRNMDCSAGMAPVYTRVEVKGASGQVCRVKYAPTR